jgi:hypothetical protein
MQIGLLATYASATIAPVLSLFAFIAYRLAQTGPLKFQEPPHFSTHFGGSFSESLKTEDVPNDLAKNTDDPITKEQLAGWRTGSTGAVGELLTGLIMIQSGWRQLPSQPDSHGIDGVFIRRVKNRAGEYEVCITETKASTGARLKGLNNYDRDRERNPAKMSDNDIIEKIRELAKTVPKQLSSVAPADAHFYLPADVAHEICDAFERGSRFVSKRLFVHSFDDQETTIYPLEPDGGYNQKTYEVVSDSMHANLLEVLEMGIGRLVKNVGRKSRLIGVIDPNKVVLSGRDQGFGLWKST